MEWWNTWKYKFSFSCEASLIIIDLSITLPCRKFSNNYRTPLETPFIINILLFWYSTYLPIKQTSNLIIKITNCIFPAIGSSENWYLKMILHSLLYILSVRTCCNECVFALFINPFVQLISQYFETIQLRFTWNRLPRASLMNLGSFLTWLFHQQELNLNILRN